MPSNMILLPQNYNRRWNIYWPVCKSEKISFVVLAMDQAQHGFDPPSNSVDPLIKLIKNF